jgi:hypothetical protein
MFSKSKICWNLDLTPFTMASRIIWQNLKLQNWFSLCKIDKSVGSTYPKYICFSPCNDNGLITSTYSLKTSNSTFFNFGFGLETVLLSITGQTFPKYYKNWTRLC